MYVTLQYFLVFCPRLSWSSGVIGHSSSCVCLVSAPKLDDWLDPLDRVDPGHAAHLLGHLHTLLRGPELGHHLGDEPAGLLGLEVTLLLWLTHNNRLDLGLANVTLKIFKS